MSEKVSNVSDADFEQKVIKSDKPTLVDFWAPWCGPCRGMAPIIDEIAAAYGDQVNFVKVNIDENQKTPATYGVRSIPTLMLFKGGKVQDTIIGLVAKERLETLVKKGVA
ncbi:MAG: thioredoxin [Deltaproteobacteria bacterium]|nr:thioredoxin [Deltaproteobacteria bacterium]